MTPTQDAHPNDVNALNTRLVSLPSTRGDASVNASSPRVPLLLEIPPQETISQTGAVTEGDTIIVRYSGDQRVCLYLFASSYSRR